MIEDNCALIHKRSLFRALSTISTYQNTILRQFHTHQDTIPFYRLYNHQTELDGRISFIEWYWFYQIQEQQYIQNRSNNKEREEKFCS